MSRLGKQINWLAILIVGFAGRAYSQNCNLCYYAYTGDMAGVVAALKQHADVNATDPKTGGSPLQYAAAYGHEDIALYLLQRGARVDAADLNGWTPLMEAVVHDEAKLVEALLERGASANVHDKEGWTPLLLASQRPTQTDVIQLLLAHHADPNERAKDGSTALDLLIRKKALPLDAVKLLLSYGANPNLSGQKEWTPLVWAARTQIPDPRLLALLLAFGGDPNTRDADLHIPLLRWVIINEDKDIRNGKWQALLSAGADPYIEVIYGDDRFLASWSACTVGADAMSFLLAHGFDTNRPASDGSTMLFQETCSGSLLLDRGAHIEDRTSKGITALADAAWQGSAGAAKTLLDLGADVSARDNQGWTPLHHASAAFHAKQLVPLLLEYGADPLDEAGRGVTPLALAKDPEVIKILQSAMDARRQSILRLKVLEEKLRQGKVTRSDALSEAAAMVGSDPGYLPLRTAVLQLTVGAASLPPVPDAALQREKAAQAAYEKAQTTSALLAVATEYEQAARLAPWVASYYRNLCVLYDSGAARERARRNCHFYLESRPEDGANFQDLLQTLNEEILRQSFPEARECIGNAVMSEPEGDRRIQFCNQAIASGRLTNYDLSSLYLQRARYKKAADSEGALHDIELAIQADPLLAQSYAEGAFLLVVRGDLDRAISYVDHALNKRLSGRDLYGFRAMLRFLRGEDRAALEDCGKAIVQNPSDIVSLEVCGHVYFAEGDYRGAALNYSAAAAVDPLNRPQNTLWMYLANARQGNNALAALASVSAGADLSQWPGPVMEAYLGKLKPREVLQRAPQMSCSADFFLGEQALLQNHKKEAEEYFRAALATKTTMLPEYRLAAVELTRLEKKQ